MAKEVDATDEEMAAFMEMLQNRQNYGDFLVYSKYRLDAIETIGRKILKEYDPPLIRPPQAVPIETIIETNLI